MRRLLPQETATFKRAPLRAALFAGLAVWALAIGIADAFGESITAFSWSLRIVAILAAAGLGALVPVGDLQRVVAGGLSFAHLAGHYALGAIMGRRERATTEDQILYVLTLVGSALLLFGAPYLLLVVWQRRKVLILPSELTREVNRISAPVGDYYREVRLLVDDGREYPVVGLFRDPYVRFGPRPGTIHASL